MEKKRMEKQETLKSRLMAAPNTLKRFSKIEIENEEKSKIKKTKMLEDLNKNDFEF